MRLKRYLKVIEIFLQVRGLERSKYRESVRTVIRRGSDSEVASLYDITSEIF